MRKKEKKGLKNLAAFLAENPGWCRAIRQRIQATQTKDELVLLIDELEPRFLESFCGSSAPAL